MTKILVTGPFGQIGVELVPELQKLYGEENVIALGHSNIPKEYKGLLEKGDVTNKEQLKEIIKKHGITEVYHLAAVLSVVGENNPELAWNVNLIAVKVVLDLAVEFKLKVFWASSMAAFGDTTPKVNTPQHTITEPITMYGVAKVSGQLLCQYYHKKFGVDVRSMRLPGIISWKAPPGGGTTDYAVQIFYDAIKTGKYCSFLAQNTSLPMMFMDDTIRAIIGIMKTPSENIKVRTSYNLKAINFTVKELADEIKKKVPNFEIEYKPDFRQGIADSWPDSIDDSEARKDWGWKHEIDLQKLVQIMLQNLKKKLA